MSSRQQKTAKMKMSGGKQTTQTSIAMDQSLDQSGIYDMGNIASVGSESLNKMQFMPQNIKKTNPIHAVGIKSAANTVSGSSGKG